MNPVPVAKNTEHARIDALATEVGLVNGRVTAVHGIVSDVRDGVSELRSAVAGMVRLEVRHEAAALLAAESRREVDSLRTDISVIKEQMPGLLETRQDVRKIVWLIVGAVIASALGLLLVKT